MGIVWFLVGSLGGLFACGKLGIQNDTMTLIFLIAGGLIGWKLFRKSCPHCQGHGFHEHLSLDPSRRVRCKTCHGSGRISIGRNPRFTGFK